MSASASNVWANIAAACQFTKEQEARILALGSTVRERRREFAATLSLLKQLEDRVTANFQGLEFEMNLLMSHVSPRQIALFLAWNESTQPLSGLVNAMLAYPQQPTTAPASGGSGMAVDVAAPGTGVSAIDDAAAAPASPAASGAAAAGAAAAPSPAAGGGGVQQYLPTGLSADAFRACFGASTTGIGVGTAAGVSDDPTAAAVAQAEAVRASMTRARRSRRPSHAAADEDDAAAAAFMMPPVVAAVSSSPAAAPAVGVSGGGGGGGGLVPSLLSSLPAFIQKKLPDIPIAGSLLLRGTTSTTAAAAAAMGAAPPVAIAS